MVEVLVQPRRSPGPAVQTCWSLELTLGQVLAKATARCAVGL
jgi:hypothetical protein